MSEVNLTHAIDRGLFAIAYAIMASATCHEKSLRTGEMVEVNQFDRDSIISILELRCGYEKNETYVIRGREGLTENDY